MKLKILSDKDKNSYEYKRKIKKELMSTKYSLFNLKFVTMSEKNVDILIIISDDLEYIYKNSFEFKNGRYKYSDLIILTSNLRSANIIGCLDLTPYVYYTKSKFDSVIFRIIKICNRRNNTTYKIPVKKDS